MNPTGPENFAQSHGVAEGQSQCLDPTCQHIFRTTHANQSCPKCNGTKTKTMVTPGQGPGADDGDRDANYSS